MMFWVLNLSQLLFGASLTQLFLFNIPSNTLPQILAGGLSPVIPYLMYLYLEH